MDALVSSRQGLKMLHSPLFDSSSKSQIPLTSINARRSFPAAVQPSAMGLNWSKKATPGHNSFTKVRQQELGKRKKTTCVYGRRAEESVLQEESPEMLDTIPSLKVFPGQAYPLGVSEVENGINFAIFSQHATSVTLCLSLPESDSFPRGKHGKLDGGMIELPLDPHANKTGDIWHISFEDLPRSKVLYGYRIDGPRDWQQGHRFDRSIVLIDPYAKLIEGRRVFGDVSDKASNFLGTYDFNTLPFDWGNHYKLPNIPEKDLVIYEMNVRAFTADESSGLHKDVRGSYLGVIEKGPRHRLVLHSFFLGSIPFSF